MVCDPLFPTAALLPLCESARARTAARGTSCGGWADDDLTAYTDDQPTDDEPADDEPGAA